MRETACSAESEITYTTLLLGPSLQTSTLRDLGISCKSLWLKNKSERDCITFCKPRNKYTLNTIYLFNRREGCGAEFKDKNFK